MELGIRARTIAWCKCFPASASHCDSCVSRYCSSFVGSSDTNLVAFFITSIWIDCVGFLTWYDDENKVKFFITTVLSENLIGWHIEWHFRFGWTPIRQPVAPCRTCTSEVVSVGWLDQICSLTLKRWCIHESRTSTVGTKDVSVTSGPVSSLECEISNSESGKSSFKLWVWVKSWKNRVSRNFQLETQFLSARNSNFSTRNSTKRNPQKCVGKKK